MQVLNLVHIQINTELKFALLSIITVQYIQLLRMLSQRSNEFISFQYERRAIATLGFDY